MPGVPTATAFRLERGIAASSSARLAADRTSARTPSDALARAGRAAKGADDLAAQVGGERKNLVRADVDAEDMAEVGAEREETRARPGPAGGAIRARLAHVPGLEEELYDLADGGLGKSRCALNACTRHWALVTDGAQDERGVESTHKLRRAAGEGLLQVLTVL